MGVVYQAEILCSWAIRRLKFLTEQRQKCQTDRRFETGRGLGAQSPERYAVHITGQYEGCPYLVMELLEGRDAQYQFTRGTLYYSNDCIKLAIQMADALDAAPEGDNPPGHQAEGNVFRDQTRPGQDLRFGIAKLIGGTAVWSFDGGAVRRTRARSR